MDISSVKIYLQNECIIRILQTASMPKRRMQQISTTFIVVDRRLDWLIPRYLEGINQASEYILEKKYARIQKIEGDIEKLQWKKGTLLRSLDKQKEQEPQKKNTNSIKSNDVYIEFESWRVKCE